MAAEMRRERSCVRVSSFRIFMVVRIMQYSASKLDKNTQIIALLQVFMFEEHGIRWCRIGDTGRAGGGEGV